MCVCVVVVVVVVVVVCGWQCVRRLALTVSWSPPQAIRDTNNNVLFTLGQLAREFPELQSSLQAALKDHGLSIPSRPPSRAVGRAPRGGGAGAGAGRPGSARSHNSVPQQQFQMGI